MPLNKKTIIVSTQKNTSLDFNAARIALQEKIAKNWQEVKNDEKQQNIWCECQTELELLAKIQNQFEALEAALKDNAKDGKVYHKTSLNEESTYLFFDTLGKKEAAEHLHFLAEALKYETVLLAIKASSISFL